MTDMQAWHRAVARTLLLIAVMVALVVGTWQPMTRKPPNPRPWHCIACGAELPPDRQQGRCLECLIGKREAGAEKGRVSGFPATDRLAIDTGVPSGRPVPVGRRNVPPPATYVRIAPIVVGR